MSEHIIIKVSYDEAVMILNALDNRARATGIKHYNYIYEKVVDNIADFRMNNAAEKAAKIARGEVA